MSTHHDTSHRHNTSRRRHHRRTSDVKAYRKTRYFFAFLLFLTLTVLSFSLTARATVLSTEHAAVIFTNQTYTQALYEDVRTYAEDMCRTNSVPASALGSVTYRRVMQVNEAYIIGTLSLDEKYTKTTYLDKLDDFSAQLEKDVRASLKAAGIPAAAGHTDGAGQLAATVTKYLKERMSFAYFDKLEALLNLGGTVSLVAAVISAVLSAVLVLVIIAMGADVYRNLRSVTHAVSAASLSSYITCLVYVYISHTKGLYFYPVYLNQSVMSFLNASAGGLLLTGGILTVASFAVMALVWKLKSDALDMSSSK